MVAFRLVEKASVSCLLIVSLSSFSSAQTILPEGTRVRLRLEQNLSSATSQLDQEVQLAVVDEIKIENQVVVSQGANATGTIVLAQPKRRMGRTGKLDFSVDRVTAIDGSSIPLRYSLNRKEGGSHSVRTGVITAGVAVLFWPAAPFMLLMKGKDTTINKGMIFEVFTDAKYAFNGQRQVQPNNLTQVTVAMPPTPAVGSKPAPTPVIVETPSPDVQVRIVCPEKVNQVPFSSGRPDRRTLACDESITIVSESQNWI